MKTIRPSTKLTFPRLPDGLHSVALGNGSRFDIGKLTMPDGTILIAVVDYGAYTFGHYATAGYVAEKLGFRGLEGDAANLADLINDQLPEPSRLALKRQGYYSPQLLEKGVLA